MLIGSLLFAGLIGVRSLLERNLETSQATRAHVVGSVYSYPRIQNSSGLFASKEANGMGVRMSICCLNRRMTFWFKILKENGDPWDLPKYGLTVKVGIVVTTLSNTA